MMVCVGEKACNPPHLWLIYCQGGELVYFLLMAMAMSMLMPINRAPQLVAVVVGPPPPIPLHFFPHPIGPRKLSPTLPLAMATPPNTLHGIPPIAPSFPDTERFVAPDSDPDPETDPETQIGTRQHWEWNSSTHWRHWHGLWTLYHPLQSLSPQKLYKSVRSLWPVDPLPQQRRHLYHRNQWYEVSGDGPDVNWECGPWAMYELKHSLPDGIWHPNSLDHRILQFPHGDLAWVQLALKPDDPKCVIFNELHIMASPDKRMPVIIGYDFEGKLGIALMLEEARDSDERPESSWKGTLWKHHESPLEAIREEPEGDFIGHEMSITSTLMSRTRKARWKGFRGGMSEEDSEDYILIHLPNGVTAFAPKTAAVGKSHAYYISWVVNADEIRVISAVYSADGRLQYAKSGTYLRC